MEVDMSHKRFQTIMFLSHLGDYLRKIYIINHKLGNFNSHDISTTLPKLKKILEMKCFIWTPISSFATLHEY